jgi:hypothetical protein
MQARRFPAIAWPQTRIFTGQLIIIPKHLNMGRKVELTGIDLSSGGGAGSAPLPVCG